MDEFVWPVRVYYEDTDAGGVVYHANYLRFLERARTEWLRGLGFEQDRLRREEGVMLAVHSLAIDFRKPARFNEAIEVSVEVTKVGGASVVFIQKIRREGELLCQAEVKVASIEAESFRPRPLPVELITRLKRCSNNV